MRPPLAEPSLDKERVSEPQVDTDRVRIVPQELALDLGRLREPSRIEERAAKVLPRGSKPGRKREGACEHRRGLLELAALDQGRTERKVGGR